MDRVGMMVGHATDGPLLGSPGADRVVIVGGGLTGLVTAHELHRRGIASIVLEADARLGGRVATVRFPDGAVAEGGMEEFWDHSPALALIDELGLGTVPLPAWSSVVLAGRLHQYVPGATEAHLDEVFGTAGRTAWSAWRASCAEVLAELDAGHRTDLDGRLSFARFVEGAQLPGRVGAWLRLVVEAETGIEWDRIGALDGIEEVRPFLGDTPGGNVRVAGGNERLVAALAAGLPAGAVRLGARVRHVAEEDGGVVAVTYETGDGRRHCERGHHAVVTTPVWTLPGLDLGPTLGRLARQALRTSAAATYVKVVLRLRPERVTIHGCGGHHPFTLLTDGPAGCIYLTSPSGRDHVLTVLVHGRHARSLVTRAAPEIVAVAVGALERLTVDGRTPILRHVASAVSDARVFPYPRAVAYWPHAHGRSRFDRLADALRAPHGRILVGGDTTDGSHSDGAVRAALRMAAHVAARRGVGALR